MHSVINQGQLVTQGSLTELQQAASTVRTPDPARLAVVLERAGATTEANAPDGLIVRGMPIEDIGKQAFEAGIPLLELSPRAGSLEELFLQWTTAPTVDQEASRP